MLLPKHTENAQELGTVALMSPPCVLLLKQIDPSSVMSPMQGILCPHVVLGSDQLGEEPILLGEDPRLKGPLP